MTADRWRTGRKITLTGDVTGTSGPFDGSSDLSFDTTIAVTTVPGNVETSDRWSTGRTITLTGDVTGVSGPFDGSANLSFATTVGHAATADSWTVGRRITLTGDVTGVSNPWYGTGNLSFATTVGHAATADSWTVGRRITLTGDVTGVSNPWYGTGNLSFATTVGNDSHSHTASTLPSGGNVETSDRWSTGRTISLTGDVTGVSGTFDGSSNLSFATSVGNDSHSHTDSTIDDLNASATTAGTFHSDRIPGLPATRIISGTFNANRIPNLNANMITNGVFNAARIPDPTNWATGRTITLTGDVTGTSPAFDGSANLSFSTQVGNDSHTHTASTLPPAGSVASADSWTTGRTITLTGDVTGTSPAFDGSSNLSFSTSVGNNSHSHNDSTINSLNASAVTAGAFHSDRIPTLNASKIIAGVFATARIPNLAASKITSGTFSTARIPDLNASAVIIGGHVPFRSYSRPATQPESHRACLTPTGFRNVATASAWISGRTITLTGDVTGTSPAFDGSGNLSFSTQVGNDSHSHTASTLPPTGSVAISRQLDNRPHNHTHR